MNFVDKMVRQAEVELKELTNDIESLNVNIETLTTRRDRKIAEEKEARKIYKQLRGKQPTKIVGPPYGEGQEKTVPTPITPTNGKVDYEGAMELLKSEDKEFSASEFGDLASAVSREAARQQLRKLADDGKIKVTKLGDRNIKDSARYKVIT